MDNIGDYLYVLVFVGIFIFNLLKKMRKATPAPQPAKPVAPPRPATFDPEDRPRYDPNFPEPPRVPKPQVITLKQAPPTPPKEEKQSTSLGKNRKEAAAVVEEEQTTLDLNLADTDQLRKGIVYAEILNRKY